MDKERLKKDAKFCKDKVKDFWHDHKREIKRTVKIGAVCILIGFLKGIEFESMNTRELIQRIPKQPDLDDLDEWLVASGMSKKELEYFINELAINDLIPNE